MTASADILEEVFQEIALVVSVTMPWVSTVSFYSPQTYQSCPESKSVSAISGIDLETSHIKLFVAWILASNLHLAAVSAACTCPD